MKIALVCSHGGHLTELLYLMEAFDGYDLFFVTYDSPRTRAMKYKKYLFPNFGEKPLEMFKNLPGFLSIMLKERPDVIVSNGAELAIPFFYIAKLLRIKTVFIECYTRVNEPTITGKIVYPVADLFLVLWRDMLKKYGKKAQYWGGLIKSCDKNNYSCDNKRDMIFVMVGMHYEGFERLVKKMDEIAGKINERVVMQVGNTCYVPKHADYLKFFKEEEKETLIKKAKIVICQGGMTIIDSLMLGTPVVAVPRLKEFGECINDHQMIFAEKLEDLGLIRIVRNIDELENMVHDYLRNQCDSRVSSKISVNRELLEKIKSELDTMK